MKIIHYPLILIAVASITACSSSPSDGDIKEALTVGLLKSCPILEISKVKKTNGIPDVNSDKLYGVEIEFTIELKPLKENKKIASEVSERIKEIQEMQAKSNVLSSKRRELKEKTQAGNSNLRSDEIYEIVEQDPEISRMTAEQNIFEKKYGSPLQYKYEGGPERLLWESMYKRVLGACESRGITFFNKITPSNYLTKITQKEIADLGDSFYTEFTASYLLRKTENGWRLAN